MFKIKIHYLFIPLLIICNACSKSNETENTDAVPALTNFIPASGSAGTSVVLNGKNFSTTIASNAVSIDGVEALVTLASSTQLTVTVPANANTGKIVIISNGSSITSATVFTVTPDKVQ